MNLLKRFSAVTIIILVLQTPFEGEAMNTSARETGQMIEFRQIGHEFLLSLGDRTSGVLPVRKIADGEYRIEFERPFAFMPDSLAGTVKRMMKTSAFTSDYIITVIEPGDQAVVYGFTTKDLKKGVVSCIGRALPQKRYAIDILTPLAPKIFGVEIQPVYVFIGLLLASLIVAAACFIRNKIRQSKTRTESIKGHMIDPGSISIGKYLFYPDRKLLICNQECAELTAKEHKLLSIFTRELNQLIDRNRLLKEGWEDKGVITGRSLDMYVSKLRKKLEKDASISITNVHGRGYSLNTGIA